MTPLAPLATAALVTCTGAEVVGLGPTLPDGAVTVAGADVRVLAGGTTTDVGVELEMAYVVVE
jgi:hypothetical protein